jgi:hypothetical protein
MALNREVGEFAAECTRTLPRVAVYKKSLAEKAVTE